MSIFRKSGLVRKPVGVYYAIYDQLKQIDLRPVQRIDYKFDPFHGSATKIRNLMTYLSAPKIRDTNFKCLVKTNVVSDLSDPEITVKLDNGKTVVFNAANLTVLEILQHFNKIVKPLVPPPDDQALSIPKTKSQKKK